MKLDSRGLAVTTDSSDAVAAIDHFADAALTLRAGMEDVTAAARAYPDCAMLQACAAALCVLSQSSIEAGKARQYLDRARTRLDDLDDRERIFIEAVGAGSEGDFDRAIGRYEQITERWPRDMLAAKIAEFHLFETGEANRQLRLMEKIAPANIDSPHVQAMYAFALELTGQRERAEKVATDALRQDPHTMWAQHCLAHVYGGQSRVDEGIIALEKFAPEWTQFGQYIQSHNWFHLATLYLARLDFDRVLDAYHRHIWGFRPQEAVEHTDAILLLWYVELAGGDAGEARWREIAPQIRARAHEQVFPFLTTIYLYALERAGEVTEVDRALSEMERYAESQTGRAAHVWQDVGLLEARGSIAFARGDYDRAAVMLGPALGEIACGGGSDEQRGVFTQAHFVSLARAGRRHEAQHAFRDYIGGHPITPLHQRWLAEIGG